MPLDTIVEDMDLTWRLIERGYRAIYTKNAFVFTDEPENFRSYRSQLDRWYGGFFECLRAHGKKIFQSKSLSFSIFFGVMQGLFTPFFIGYLIYAFYNSDFVSGVALILLNFLLQFGITAYQASRTRRLKTILRGTVVTFVLSMIDTLIWNKCLIKYGLLGKRVRSWNFEVKRAH